MDNIHLILVLIILILLSSCTTYNSQLHTKNKLELESMKKGKSCAKYLLGGFKLPYIGQTAIRITGSESLSKAITMANITEPYIVDTEKTNYGLASKKCIIVFGK